MYITLGLAELLALWSILYLTKACRIEDVLIVGDSQVIIGWEKGVWIFHSLILDQWKMKVKRLISMFNGVSFQHIYREYNDVVDRLTNVGIGNIDGFIHFEAWLNSSLSRAGRLDTTWGTLPLTWLDIFCSYMHVKCLHIQCAVILWNIRWQLIWFHCGCNVLVSDPMWLMYPS